MDTSAACCSHFEGVWLWSWILHEVTALIKKKVSVFYGGVSIKIKRFIIKMLSAFCSLFTLNK